MCNPIGWAPQNTKVANFCALQRWIGNAFKATCTRIRFRKDPFWGVHTYRTSIRRPRSHGRGLILGNVPPPENHGLWERMPWAQIALFCLFPLLASVVLLYCFTRLCPMEGVYVVCESWRQVIKERLQRQNETQTKHPTFVEEGNVVELLLKTTATILRFVFEGNSLRNKKKWAATGFGNKTENAREAIFIAWARHFWSPWKQWQKRSGYHVHTQKRSGSETSVFERSTFGSVFEKLRFGARAFSKSSGYVRIRVTVSMYPGSKSSVFEKTRVRVHVA